MKGLTSVKKEESIEKWEEIIRLVKEKSLADYMRYWDACGFCYAASSHCSKCSLYKCLVDERRVCHRRMRKYESHASLALAAADDRDWVDALYHAKIVLAAIKRAKVDRPAGTD